jgi:hypothetical protein
MGPGEDAVAVVAATDSANQQLHLSELNPNCSV